LGNPDILRCALCREHHGGWRCFFVVFIAEAAFCKLKNDAYFEKRDNDRAIGSYTHAIQLKPTFAAAYYSRSLVYSKKGESHC
jgi:tetratricopeptide (TPR) repeat protein